VWRNPLDGSAVYGQPLVAGDKILVATEEDNVYALDPRTGRIAWQVNVGQPLRGVARFAGCGNVDPLGVTSTPVVDTSSDTVYVVAEVAGAGGRPPVHHQLVGLAISTGRTTLSVDVDPPLPPGESPISLLQRAALAFGNGRVYVGFGGHYGDCGLYHGWVVAVPVTSSGGAGPETAFDVTPFSTGGAVWQSGGGPSIDARGDVYISTGNPNSGGPAPWAEAVVKLSPGLDSPPEASFQDTLATGDLDLGTGDVVLLPGGQLFVVGKTRVGYLLSQASLTPVAPIDGDICGSDPDGGAAFDASTDSIYVPCRGGGIAQVRLSAHRVGWQSGEVNSSPILVDGYLWALSYPTGTLEQLDPATGHAVQTIPVGAGVPNFASPSAGMGLLLVGTDHGIAAFAGPSGPPQV
jgi:outer membrane protein assembly factor BamB